MGIWQDAKSMAEKDPAAKSVWEVFFLYSGFHAIFWHRIAHWCWTHHLHFLARTVSQFSRWLTGIEIHPGAKIGQQLFIDHGMGIVIGETAEIGDNCTIYHGVTLGGTGKDSGKRHPTLGNNVLVGAGAKILGPFHVGDNARIGANAVVLSEIPADATVVGVPGHPTDSGIHGISSTELDQTNLPDPVEQELERLNREIAAIKEAMQKN